MLGEAYLRHPGEGDEAVVRARDALAELRLSLEVFGLEEDVPYALGTPEAEPMTWQDMVDLLNR